MPRIQPPFKILGMDRYCPDCSRLLLHINEDGSCETDGNVNCKIEVGIDEETGEEEAILVDAVCTNCHPEEIPFPGLGPMPLLAMAATGIEGIAAAMLAIAERNGGRIPDDFPVAPEGAYEVLPKECHHLLREHAERWQRRHSLLGRIKAVFTG